MYLALIVLPILGSIVSGFFGRKVGVSGSHLITCTCVISTTILAILVFIEVGLNNIPVKVHLFRWIDAEYLNVSWAFNFDSLTVSMLIPVLIVSSLVHVYSIGYMSHDPHNQRFFSYLSLFTFMMIILVTGDNFLVMFVGWEGVGVCSYLLVSFWFTRIPANQSSLAAFLTNRVGDCVLTIGMFAILWSFGNVDYTTVFSLAPFYSENIIIFIGVCLLVGAMAKSSQVGLHIWLPMAMEGPTPVSALIHAATMVTAGVYLLMRASPLIEYSSTVLLLCLWVGAITTVFSSLVGLFQQDIKKVIAYSTMSQLGMMVIAIGLSSYNVALFHLVNHAFYKGLLFLGAGSVIHAVADNQDFRKYGGLISYMPLTYSVMLIASLSLVAFPFMTGFYSKDFILESAYGQYHLSGIIVYFVATIGAMFTTLYSVKVLYLTFLSNPNGPIVNYKADKAAHEGDIFMSMPLIILAVFSIFFGYITKDIFIGMGSDFFSDNGLYIHPSHEKLLDTEFAVSTTYKLLPLFFTISLTIVSLFFTEFFPKNLIKFKFSRLGYSIFGFFNQRFLVEMYYNKYISGQILKLGGHTTKVLDKGAVEIFGPHGLEKKLTEISSSINSLSTGIVTSYALYILIGLIFYISVIYLSQGPNDSLYLIIVLYALISINQSATTVNKSYLKEKSFFYFFNIKNIFDFLKKLVCNKIVWFNFISSILIAIFTYCYFNPSETSLAELGLLRILSHSFAGLIFMITFHKELSIYQVGMKGLGKYVSSFVNIFSYIYMELKLFGFKNVVTGGRNKYGSNTCQMVNGQNTEQVSVSNSVTPNVIPGSILDNASPDLSYERPGWGQDIDNPQSKTLCSALDIFNFSENCSNQDKVRILAKQTVERPDMMHTYLKHYAVINAFNKHFSENPSDREKVLTRFLASLEQDNRARRFTLEEVGAFKSIGLGEKLEPFKTRSLNSAELTSKDHITNFTLRLKLFDAAFPGPGNPIRANTKRILGEEIANIQYSRSRIK